MVPVVDLAGSIVPEKGRKAAASGRVRLDFAAKVPLALQIHRACARAQPLGGEGGHALCSQPGSGSARCLDDAWRTIAWVS